MIIKSRHKSKKQSNQKVREEEIKKAVPKYNVIFKEEPKNEIPIIEENIIFNLLEEEE